MDCDYQLHCGDATYCRHSRVHIAGQRVNEYICSRCTDRLQVVTMREFCCDTLPDQTVLLGDRIAKKLERIGIKKTKGCGCSKRQAAINKADWAVRRWARKLKDWLLAEV